jgi:hypothetical protein
MLQIKKATDPMDNTDRNIPVRRPCLPYGPWPKMFPFNRNSYFLTAPAM